MSRPVHLNRVATAVPAHDVHRKFLDYAPRLLEDERTRRLFERLAGRAQIEHRYSFVEPDPAPGRLDRAGFFTRGAFPDTATRMRFYEAHALGLALEALGRLGIETIREEVTHLIVTTCTGFYAPGLDLQIIEALGLSPGVERTMVGFMGCQAAIPAMKLATHIVRSVPEARVLMLNLELCTIHLQERGSLEQMLSFVIFADGCAASILSAEPVGFEITGFRSAVMPESREQISWHIREHGFLMHLAGTVPATIGRGLPEHVRNLLGGRDQSEVGLWAIHPGGRTVLDAVQGSLGLDERALAASRGVLRDYGNMSSATVMFVLERLLAEAGPPQGSGCAIAFGPGLTAEAMTFERASP